MHPKVMQYPHDLNAPGAVEALLSFHAAQFGTLVMEDDPDGGDDTTPPEDTPPADTAGPKLVAALAAERVKRQAAEKTLRETKAAEAAKARESDSAETARVRAELEAERDALQSQLANALAGRTLDAARMAATEAGVDVAHVSTFLRLVDLSEVRMGPDGTLDTPAIVKAVELGLESAPMFKPPLPGGQEGARRAYPGSGAGATAPPAGDLAAKIAAKTAAMQRSLGQTVTAV